jgi:hypothetical protein
MSWKIRVMTNGHRFYEFNHNTHTCCEQISSVVVVCSLFNDAFSVSQTMLRRFLLNPDSSVI